MSKCIKMAVALAALTALGTSSAAYAGKSTCGANVWNLLVLAKKCA